jgi:hypothetical protein
MTRMCERSILNHRRARGLAGLGALAVLPLLLAGCASAPPPVASVQIPGHPSPYIGSMQK